MQAVAASCKQVQHIHPDCYSVSADALAQAVVAYCLRLYVLLQGILPKHLGCVGAGCGVAQGMINQGMAYFFIKCNRFLIKIDFLSLFIFFKKAMHAIICNKKVFSFNTRVDLHIKCRY